MTQEHNNQPSFYGLGIAPGILEVLAKLKFHTPTPIQHQAIPIAMEGKDLVGIAQTGTGKTLAFGIPMLQKLVGTKEKGLVVLPTRELALQVDEMLQKIGIAVNLKTAVLIGGQSMQPQLKALKRNPHIIIATPGRLLDHMMQRTVSLTSVTVLVLDEADRMLDMGFQPQIQKILAAVPRERQTMLFSATLPPDIMNIATKAMRTPIRIEVARPGTAAERVAQEIFVVSREGKGQLLQKVLQEYKGSVLVFTQMKFGARRVAAMVRALGHSSAEIHSNRSLGQRREALEGFKSGKYRVLVATDIAARGIDVRGIELVVNYDLPSTPDDYVHRIGRTGRAGTEGTAISFALPTEFSEIRAIERLTRKSIRVSTPAGQEGLHKRPEVPKEATAGPRHPSHPRGGRDEKYVPRRMWRVRR